MCIVLYIEAIEIPSPEGSFGPFPVPERGCSPMTASIASDLREIVAVRVERQMLGAEAASVARLMATGLAFAAIRDALTERALGNPEWKADRKSVV